ncbi:MAG: DUF2567 domain-containing protein [Mycobacterium sp.]
MTVAAEGPESALPPKLSHRAAALRVAIGFALAGVLVGALWALVVPPIHGAIVLSRKGERVSGFIGDESDRVFLGAALLVGFLGVLAAVTTVLVWQWRAHRGPLMAAALALGGLAAGGAAPGVGAALAYWRYGSVDIAAAPVSAEHRVFYTTEAPSAVFGHSPWLLAATVFFPAGIAALVYAFCVLATKRDDLGAWPPVEPSMTGAPILADSPTDDALPSVG